MKGRLVFSKELQDKRIDLEELIRRLPVVAVSDWRVKPNENSDEDQIPEEKLVYLVSERKSDFETNGCEITPRNHPEIGGVGFYEIDKTDTEGEGLALSGKFMDKTRSIKFQGITFYLNTTNIISGIQQI